MKTSSACLWCHPRLAALLSLALASSLLGCAGASPAPKPVPAQPAAVAAKSPPGMLGIWFRGIDTGAEVLGVKADGPAARAGILPGDVILKAGDKVLAKLSAAETAQALGGPLGTQVSLTILRPGTEEPAARTWTCRLQRESLTWQSADRIDPANLLSLLISADASVAEARQRNRALVEAKTVTLPVVLQQRKTAELTALAVRIEQTMLDLNHEAELAKDRAQRLAESNPAAVEPQRELAIAYKERIEILKPIGAAIKEELANRAK